MRMINQPFGESTMGAELVHQLDALQGPGSAVRIAVAYTRATGVLRLAPAIQRYRDRGGYVEAIVGIGRDSVTSRQALEILLDYSDRLLAFSNASTTFHPKVYLLREGRTRAVAYVGSNNLTTGGLYTNYEAALGIDLNFAVHEHRRVYSEVSRVIRLAKKDGAMVTQVTNVDVIAELDEQGLLRDETRPERRRTSQGGGVRSPAAQAGKFPPPPPPIEEELRPRVPRVRRRDVVIEPGAPEVAAGPPVPPEAAVRTFVMILDNRDARQLAGYSTELYIPLGARDEDPGFWGWPGQYTLSGARHPERRINVLVRPVAGETTVAANKRFWFYGARSEFRFNNRELIAGSKPGDLLVVYRVAGVWNGTDYEYEAAVIPPDDPAYDGYLSVCVNVASDIKAWGYM